MKLVTQLELELGKDLVNINHSKLWEAMKDCCDQDLNLLESRDPSPLSPSLLVSRARSRSLLSL